MAPRSRRQWTLPGGGIDFGEPIEHGMMREVLEETGLAVEPRDVAFVDDWIYHTPYSSCHNIRIVYWAKVIGGTLRDEVDGSTDRCKYFRLARAAQIDLVDLAQLGVDAVRSRSSGFH